jgi:hypothetical protein
MHELLQINNESEDSLFNSFLGIANQLMNEYHLQVRDNYYRIIDCEFYYHSPNHDDGYVHGHKRQKETLGAWYFHGSGLDITLANGISYGGILIRAIAKVSDDRESPSKEDAIIGPLNVCTEIFKQIGSVTCNSIFFGLREVPADKQKKAEIHPVERVGLKNKGDKFFFRPYRFISFLKLPHRNIEKIRRNANSHTFS